MSNMHRRYSSFLLCLIVFGLVLSPGLLAQSKSLAGRVVQSESGKPIPGAVVTLAGLPGTAKTDANGEFTWNAPPSPPFQLIIVLPGGHVARPVEVKTLDGAVLSIAVDSLASESVTVMGAAPSIVAAPAAAKTLLSDAQVTRRNPENLMQALETVPGVNAVSEGHATVPAIRGMARGRTLLLIDGARVSSERRVGPSATFADPAMFEGLDVARGPGSVAYGSDALGGVISVRTRRAQPGSDFSIKGSGTYGGGVPDRRGTLEVAKGLAKGGLFAQVHARGADDWDSPIDDSSILNSGWEDSGFNARVDHQLGKGLFSAGWQGDFGRDIERPRNNSQTVRFYYPYRGLASTDVVLRDGDAGSAPAVRDHRFCRHLQTAHGPGPVRHGDDRTQHRACRCFRRRLPRQGQRGPRPRSGPPRVRRRRQWPLRPRSHRHHPAL